MAPPIFIAISENAPSPAAGDERHDSASAAFVPWILPLRLPVSLTHGRVVLDPMGREADPNFNISA
jgi:hypothetical protein